MSISLSDVAKRAGVSSGTVSHVLNGNKSARIAESTQQRIRTIAKEMNYRPNSFARNIARQRTNTLRLICPSHDNPFYIRVTKAVDINTRKAGYKLWTDATLNERWHYGPGEEVGIWPVDGALIWADTALDLEFFLGWQAETIPVVYLGFQGKDAVDTVTNDMYEGGRRVGEHMVAQGYRRIAYLSPHYHRNFPGSDQRMRAYEDVCRETGREVEHFHILDQVVEPEYKLGMELGVDFAARPASERPDAVICLNDTLAIGFYHGVRRAGLRVPDDIAIAGFDGITEGQCLDLPLTSVSIPVDSMCQAAIALIIQRIQGDRETPPQRLVFPTELLIGGTT